MDSNDTKAIDSKKHFNHNNEFNFFKLNDYDIYLLQFYSKLNKTPNDDLKLLKFNVEELCYHYFFYSDVISPEFDTLIKEEIRSVIYSNNLVSKILGFDFNHYNSRVSFLPYLIDSISDELSSEKKDIDFDKCFNFSRDLVFTYYVINNSDSYEIYSSLSLITKLFFFLDKFDYELEPDRPKNLTLPNEDLEYHICNKFIFN